MRSTAREKHGKKFSDMTNALFSALPARQCNPRNESTATTTTMKPTM
jgi:hypothetical protein